MNGQNYDSPFKYQGFCGSCYSMATVQMLETRVRIMSNNTHRVVLSSQDAVSCSRYNQGCDGGYPFLVAKHAQDFGIVPDDCLPYAPGTDCGRKCANPSMRVGVTQYYYVGGYYGGCTEAAMAQELVSNGPFVVSFNAGSDFMFYSGGVYTQSTWGDSFLEVSENTGNATLRQWEKTTHSVLLVGYGESPADGKFWIAKNTWGAQWGENGYFRIRRGTDECAFESMAMAALPIVHAGHDFEKSLSADGSDSSLPSQPPTDAQWKDSSLLQEEEGGISDGGASDGLGGGGEVDASGEVIPGGDSQVASFQKEMDDMQDPEYAKEYPAMKKPTLTNDMGVSLHAPMKPGSDDDDDVSKLRSSPKDLEQETTDHHHHHHHHEGGDEHHHHHHHQHNDEMAVSSTTTTHPASPKRYLVEGVQLEEGVGEFVDPVDE